ncbi:hypothetical protein MBHK15_120218 [Marinobacter salarius]|nr:hypothetical protein MBHK15_120218 [Marinobacter salarius]
MIAMLKPEILPACKNNCLTLASMLIVYDIVVFRSEAWAPIAFIEVSGVNNEPFSNPDSVQPWARGLRSRICGHL